MEDLVESAVMVEDAEDDGTEPLRLFEPPADYITNGQVRDIYPRTPIASLRRDYAEADLERTFSLDVVAAVTGMSDTYITRALPGRSRTLSLRDALSLLDLDAFSETFIPRSRVPQYLLDLPDVPSDSAKPKDLPLPGSWDLIYGSAKDLLPRLPVNSIQCVVTSTPYWGTRIYEDWVEVEWADGEVCPFGHEQTPEGFIRHTIELLYLLKPAMTQDGSVWWNLMDTYNTRTQIRGNAAETLRAMQGNDSRGWHDHAARRYSAGHSFLQDGEQCLIPQRVAERASRIGYWVKSMITWKKANSMPETVATRVTRELEYITHLSVQRTPYFDKECYNTLSPHLGGREPGYESEKLTDIWYLPTSVGADGHGAQFPVRLPARCIALTSKKGDVVLDPFMGSGTTGVAARKLDRRSLGFDVSEKYLKTARKRHGRAEQLALMESSSSADFLPDPDTEQ